MMRIDIGDGLRERPDVAAGVFGGVLSLPEWEALWRLRDPRTMLPCMRIVAIHVRDPHEYRVARMGTLVHGPLRQDDCALASDKLDTMVSYPQPLPKTEGLAEPCARLPHILVTEHRNNRRRWHRAIFDHAVLSPFHRYCREQAFECQIAWWMAIGVHRVYTPQAESYAANPAWSDIVEWVCGGQSSSVIGEVSHGKPSRSLPYQSNGLTLLLAQRAFPCRRVGFLMMT